MYYILLSYIRSAESNKFLLHIDTLCILCARRRWTRSALYNITNSRYSICVAVNGQGMSSSRFIDSKRLTFHGREYHIFYRRYQTNNNINKIGNNYIFFWYFKKKTNRELARRVTYSHYSHADSVMWTHVKSCNLFVFFFFRFLARRMHIHTIILY